ncbi:MULTISPECIES: hypothetical protein [unclassified Haloarcula]|jgi:uncharacterized protein YwgA|uniref:hypothetical protein n=1 Tax=unclassified Haloarcula TaxID=2624677 RepID=UPI0005955721|nr:MULTISPECIES: hypothetical protein [unclassified Haloarcula]AJF27985.1 hypothetical protein SG26_19705 [Haloarcula sp. CBA1115]RLM33122.1 hypothetical protein DVK01_18165 [Haloarcula sp. Atlit-120R]
MPSQRELLLMLFEESEQHKIEGRTRLQKLVFLVQQLWDQSDSEVFNFEPYDYGPFSADILHELDHMEEDGLIEEQVTRLPKGKKYTYTLTDQGEQYLSETSDVSDGEIGSVVQRVISQFDSMPISRLLEYVYNKFPDYTVNSKL